MANNTCIEDIKDNPNLQHLVSVMELCYKTYKGKKLNLFPYEEWLCKPIYLIKLEQIPFALRTLSARNPRTIIGATQGYWVDFSNNSVKVGWQTFWVPPVCNGVYVYPKSNLSVKIVWANVEYIVHATVNPDLRSGIRWDKVTTINGDVCIDKDVFNKRFIMGELIKARLATYS